MRALPAIFAVLLAVTARAGDERTTVAEFARAHVADVAIVEGNGGAGSAFIARIGRGRYLITNQHVVAGMDAPVFTSPDRTCLRIGTAAAAEGHDIMSFGIEQTGSALDVMQEVERHVAVGDDVAVLGNPNGEGVIHPITGRVLGIGPQLVEISAEFVPGNSGSPIVHMRTGKVIAVATYIRIEPSSVLNGRETARPRRFGYRLDSIRKWLPVRMWEFNDEQKTVVKIRERTQDLTEIVLHMRESRRLNPGILLDPEIRATFERFATGAGQAGDAATYTKNAADFLENLLRASTDDITHARRRLSYDCFVRQLERESDIRQPIPRVLGALLKTKPQF